MENWADFKTYKIPRPKICRSYSMSAGPQSAGTRYGFKLAHNRISYKLPPTPHPEMNNNSATAAAAPPPPTAADKVSLLFTKKLLISSPTRRGDADGTKAAKYPSRPGKGVSISSRMTTPAGGPQHTGPKHVATSKPGPGNSPLTLADKENANLHQPLTAGTRKIIH